MIEFQISTKHTGTKRRIKVMVYDTLDQLKRATRKRDGFYGWPQEQAWYEGMAAVTQSHTILRDDDSTPYVTMRLSRDKLHQFPTEIITHESAHAALFLYRHDTNHTTSMEDVTTLKDVDDQETLCYLVGEISRKVVNKLYEKQVL